MTASGLDLPAVAELAKAPQWVVWRWEKNGAGKPDKPPRRARDGALASHSRRSDWTTFETAKAALLNGGGWNGLGFVFMKENRLTGVDLDNCRDPDTGEIRAWARRLVERFNTYTEVSPSGTGLKLFGRGWVPRGRKVGDIELYDHARYFTVTGRHLAGTPDTIEDISGALAELWQELEGDDPLDGAGPAVDVHYDPGADVALIRNKVRELLDRSERFHATWEHRRPELRKGNGDPDLSRHDLALCTIAALRGWGDTELSLLIRAHREARGRTRRDVEKWRRKDYVRGTIELARSYAEAQKAENEFTAEPCAVAEADPPPVTVDRGNVVELHPSSRDLDAAEVEELARLSPLAYDQKRQATAKRLGVRVATLDRAVEHRRAEIAEPAEPPTKGGQGRPLELHEPEPWPEPVDGAGLLDGIAAAFRRYLALPDHADTALALWCLYAHAYCAFHITPRLALTSPEKRCGKSTTLALIRRLVPRPLPAASITAAAMFRAVEVARPTLLVDEADTFLANSDELRGVLNSGHEQGGCVIRCVGDDAEPRQFTTFAPVAIAAIGRLPGTLEDRSVIVPMRRRAPDETVERFRPDRCGHLEDLARKAARWTADCRMALAVSDPDVPAGLHDRAADNWRALLAVADLAGGVWPDRARRAAVALSGGDATEDPSAKVQLLADIRDLFEARRADELPSQTICDALAALEGRPWPEWKAGKPITPRQVARLLSAFGIGPGTVRVGPGTTGTPKGYKCRQFDDAFARYLPAQSATTPQSPEDLDSRPDAIRHKGDVVADESGLELRQSLACGGVADRGPELDADAEERAAIMESDGADSEDAVERVEL